MNKLIKICEGLAAICSVQDENRVNATSLIVCGMSIPQSRAHSADFSARGALGAARCSHLQTAIATPGLAKVVTFEL